MCSTASRTLCFTFLNFLVLVQCAPELPVEDSYGIVTTEWAIRNTLNNLFSTLKLKVMQQKLKFKQYSTIHNFFVSITLRDHNNLKKIVKLTEVENIDNGTRFFITQLNEVSDEDNKSDEARDTVYVKILIEEFINRLDKLKERNELHNNTKFDLNKAILRHFSDHENEFQNTTYLKEWLIQRNNSDDVLDSIESWEPSGRRIFGGTRSTIKRFPFMASVQFFKKFQCGGSIVKSDLVITSASCLQLAWNNRFFRENPAFLSVQVGSTLYENGGENIPVLELHFHPGFDPKNLRHNLALMRLTRVLKFSKKRSKIKKINFDKNPWPLPANSNGIVVVGWGARTFGTHIVNLWKNVLSFSNLDFYPLPECQEVYTKDYVTERNFCAGFFSKGGGACNHDAGGPGILSGILVGVISFGSPVCGTPDAPTVFTKLGYYKDWIEEIMESEVLRGYKHTTPRQYASPKYDLPSFKKTTRFKIRPITYKNPSKPSDSLRTDDEKHEFKDFLKTMFKEKKDIAQQQKQEDELQEEEEETEQIQEETEEVTGFLFEDKEQDLKEVDKFKPVALRNKPSRGKTEKKTNYQEKVQITAESQSQSQEFPVDVISTIQPSTIKYATLLKDDYDPNALSTIAFNLRNDGKKESVNEETDIDEAIETLIDNLDIDAILESEDSSSIDQRRMRAREELNKNAKLNKLNPKTDPTKTKNSAVVNQNINENEDLGHNANNSDKLNEKGKSDRSENVSDVQTVDKDDENQDYETDDAGEMDEDVSFSIPAEELEKEHSSNSTERLIEMMEYEDIYKLLAGTPL